MCLYKCSCVLINDTVSQIERWAVCKHVQCHMCIKEFFFLPLHAFPRNGQKVLSCTVLKSQAYTVFYDHVFSTSLITESNEILVRAIYTHKQSQFKCTLPLLGHVKCVFVQGNTSSHAGVISPSPLFINISQHQ